MFLKHCGLADFLTTTKHSFPEPSEFVAMSTVTPVSYTHLDVYKRQGLYSGKLWTGMLTFMEIG